MKARHCCQIRTRPGGDAHCPACWWRRGGELAGLIAPTVTLAALPKCPVCLAAYFALATGIGISLPAAACLRTMLMVSCVATLVFLGARLWHRTHHRRFRL